MLDWMKHKLESRLPGEISITSDMQMTSPLWQKAKRNYRVSWLKWIGEWKSWLKTQHWKSEDHGVTSWQIEGETMETVTAFIFLGSKITADGYCSHKIKRLLFLERKVLTKLDSILKSRDKILLTKVHRVKVNDFSSSHVWVWEFDHKEGWMLKNWYFWAVVLEKTLESPLDCKEIKPVSPEGNQSQIFIGRTDSEAEASILWPPDGKSWVTGKDPDTWKDWRQEKKQMTEDEMVG